jgi:hypothetical protein
MTVTGNVTTGSARRDVEIDGLDNRWSITNVELQEGCDADKSTGFNSEVAITVIEECLNSATEILTFD